MQGDSQTRLIQFFDDWLSYRAQTRTMPGFSVAVIRGEAVIYTRAFGLANMYQQEALTPRHLFYIGSQSKMMTAVLTMQLAEKGLLALHDKAARYVPWLREHRDKRFRYFTVEQLLWHGSGVLRDGRDADFWQLQRPFPDDAELRSMVLASDMVIDSAQEVKYSNVGYALLGQIIEQAGGATYEEQAKQRIIKPLGLRHTVVGTSGSGPHDCATGYTHHIDGRRYEVSPRVATNAYHAVVGWQSTTEDMGKFMISLYGDDETLLSNANKAKLIRGERRYWLPPGPGRSEYGLGFLQQQIGDQLLYGHAGAFVTHRSCSYFNPDTKIGVAIMANANDAPVNEMAMGVFDVVSHFEPYLRVPIEAGLRRFDVLLENMLGCRQVLAIGDKLEAVAFNDWFPFDDTEQLHVIDDHTLRVAHTSFLAAPGETIQYVFKDEGDVMSVRYTGMLSWPRSDFVRLFPHQRT